MTIDKFGRHIAVNSAPPIIISSFDTPTPPPVAMALTSNLKRTMSSSDFDLENKRIRNLAPPQNELDAVNLSMVRDLFKQERIIRQAEIETLKMDLYTQLEQLQKRKSSPPPRGEQGPPGPSGPPGPPRPPGPQGLNGAAGVCFTLTNDGHFDITDKRLTQVHDPVDVNDAINLKTFTELRTLVQTHHDVIRQIMANLLDGVDNQKDEEVTRGGGAASRRIRRRSL